MNVCLGRFWLGYLSSMILILALLVVLLLAAGGFALHVLWVIAVVAMIVWVLGALMGRGEAAGRHHFYNW